MQITGNLLKMKTEQAQPVKYFLRLGEEKVLLNEYLGQPVSLRFEGQINCINCGRKTPKSFAQGFCFPCFQKSPENSDCILRPELCRGHLGLGRDPQWELEHHVQPHAIYLAKSSGIKVGITRETQIPTRWIDQGASEALVLARTPNRYLAGLIEVEMKKYIGDKTNWQRMLKGETSSESLSEVKAILKEKFHEDIRPYLSDEAELTEITYPVLRYPAKVNSLSFEKQAEVSGLLMGIKGQYLIFEDGSVINIRSHGGYLVTFSA